MINLSERFGGKVPGASMNGYLNVDAKVPAGARGVAGKREEGEERDGG